MSADENASTVINDAVIEKFVADPDSLDPTLRQSVKNLLDHDACTRSVAEFYSAFYRELAHLPTRPPASVELFIESIFPISTVVPLFQFEPRNVTSNSSLAELIPTLTSNGVRSPFRPAILLGSKEAGVVACLLASVRSPEECRAYVLTTDPSKRANVMLSFPEISFDVFLEDGTADFTLPDADIDPALLATAMLRFPTFEIQWRSGRFESDQLRIAESDRVILPSGHSLELRVAHAGFELHLDPRDAEFPTTIRRISITDFQGETAITSVAAGKARSPIASLAEGWVVRMYN